MASLSPRILYRAATTTARSSVPSRSISIKATGVRYAKHGHFNSVLKSESFDIDTAAIKSNEIVVRMLAAPVSGYDLQQISGYYGKLGSGPRVAGNEGVGIVEAAGSGVTGLSKGNVVVASAPGAGTWATHSVSAADNWTRIDDVASAPGSATFPVEHAAVAVGAPVTAKLLLERASAAGAGKSGSTIIQNGAHSAIGLAFLQYAAAAGVKTINILAKPADEWGNRVYHYQGLGATIVVDEEYAATPQFAKLIADLPAPTFGLNSSGGSAASAVATALVPGGTMVTYGGVSRMPLRIPSSWFTVRGLTLSGFSLDSHLKGLKKSDRDTLVRSAVSDVEGGEEKARVKVLVARESFGNWSRALEKAISTPVNTGRQVVLTF